MIFVPKYLLYHSKNRIRISFWAHELNIQFSQENVTINRSNDLSSYFVNHQGNEEMLNFDDTIEYFAWLRPTLSGKHDAC